MQLGIHATPKKNLRAIEKHGLCRQPFWRNRQPLKRLLGGRITCDAWVLKLGTNGKSLKQNVQMVLERANKHYTKKENARIAISRIRLFLVDLEKSTIIKKRGEREVAVKSEPHTLKRIELTDNELKFVEEQTRDMDTPSANQYIVDYVARKVQDQIRKV
jgi:hypothetical protein